jgi:hypothetical protein
VPLFAPAAAVNSYVCVCVCVCVCQCWGSSGPAGPQWALQGSSTSAGVLCGPWPRQFPTRQLCVHRMGPCVMCDLCVPPSPFQPERLSGLPHVACRLPLSCCLRCCWFVVLSVATCLFVALFVATPAEQALRSRVGCMLGGGVRVVQSCALWTFASLTLPLQAQPLRSRIKRLLPCVAAVSRLQCCSVYAHCSPSIHTCVTQRWHTPSRHPCMPPRTSCVPPPQPQETSTPASGPHWLVHHARLQRTGGGLPASWCVPGWALCRCAPSE